MAKFDPGAYPITIRIARGILLVQCAELGIALSRNFDLIRKSSDVGDLYFEVFKRVSDELLRREKDSRSVPAPVRPTLAKVHDEQFEVSMSEAMRITGLAADTIRRLSKEDLPCFKTPKGHRRYRASDLLKISSKI